MRIGIDIDDTVAHTVDKMVYYADKYDIEVLGNKGSNKNLGLIKDHHYLKELYGWDYDTKNSFFNMYYKNVLEDCEPRLDAIEIINKLKNEGHEIYFITARLETIPTCKTYDITKDWLIRKGFPVDFLQTNASDKSIVCSKNNVDILIDDSLSNCESARNIGVKSLLITTIMNNKLDTNVIKRVKDWYEIYDFINIKE